MLKVCLHIQACLCVTKSACVYFPFTLSKLISERRIWDGVSQQVLTGGMTLEVQQHTSNKTGGGVFIRQTGLGFGVPYQAMGACFMLENSHCETQELTENDSMMKKRPRWAHSFWCSFC